MLRPLQINLGQPGPGQVVGRTAVLAELRTALERGTSILVTGERRIGKSWVLKELVAHPPDGWTAVYTDVEHLASAEELSARLLAGSGISDNAGELARAMAIATGGVPFYVQLLAGDLERLHLSGRTPAVPEVERLRDEALTSGDDPWRMRHYDDRLTEYFGSEASIARATLTAIAFADVPLAFGPVADRVRTDGDVSRGNADVADVPDATIRDVMRRLLLDHYLVAESDGSGYRFSFDVVRDAWRAMYR